MRYIQEKAGPRRSLPRAFALAAAAAALMALAVPNEFFKYGLPPLGFIALAPLYIAVLEAGSVRASAFVVGLFGSLQHALSSFWLWFFKDFRVWTLGSTTVAYFVVYMVLGLYLWLFLCRSDKARPAAFAFLWVAFEYMKSNGFLGYPWGLLPYSLTDALPMLQIADLGGVYMVGFVLAAANAAVAEFLLGLGRSSREAVGRGSPLGGRAPSAEALPPRARFAVAGLALALSALTLGYGLARMAIPVRQIGTIDAILVQQNTDPWVGTEDEGLMADIRLARQAMAGGSPEAGSGSASSAGAAGPLQRRGPPDLILFSETSLTRPYAEFRKYFTKHPATDPLVPFIKEAGAWLFTGAPVVVDWQTGEATNSAILIDPEARMVGSYAKIHPVPFAEAIPFWEFAPFRRFIQQEVGLESGWVMGTEYVVFDLPAKGGTFRFGAPICFEDAFAGVCGRFFQNGADLLVNLTDVSWSKTDSAEIQHWAAARFRSIEARRTLARSTNGGLTCVVGPYGQVLYSLPLFKAAALRCELPVYRDASPTIYLRFGDWFARAALLLSAALFIILSIAERKRREA